MCLERLLQVGGFDMVGATPWWIAIAIAVDHELLFKGDETFPRYQRPLCSRYQRRFQRFHA